MKIRCNLFNITLIAESEIAKVAKPVEEIVLLGMIGGQGPLPSPCKEGRNLKHMSDI